jgi:hypothetical protein
MPALQSRPRLVAAAAAAALLLLAFGSSLPGAVAAAAPGPRGPRGPREAAQRGLKGGGGKGSCNNPMMMKCQRMKRMTMMRAAPAPAPSPAPPSRSATAPPSSGPSPSPTARPTQAPTSSPTPRPTNYVDCATLQRFDTGAGANNHLYGSVQARQVLPWFEAREYTRNLNQCCNRTAHLASITSANEHIFIVTKVHNSGWIGLNNLNQTSASNYVWDGTSEAVGYTNWCPRAGPFDGFSGCQAQSPYGEADTCGALGRATIPDDSGGYLFYWFDGYCSGELWKSFIVEYDCQ